MSRVVMKHAIWNFKNKMLRKVMHQKFETQMQIIMERSLHGPQWGLRAKITQRTTAQKLFTSDQLEICSMRKKITCVLHNRYLQFSFFKFLNLCFSLYLLCYVYCWVFGEWSGSTFLYLLNSRNPTQHGYVIVAPIARIFMHSPTHSCTVM